MVIVKSQIYDSLFVNAYDAINVGDFVTSKKVRLSNGEMDCIVSLYKNSIVQAIALNTTLTANLFNDTYDPFLTRIAISIEGDYETKNFNRDNVYNLFDKLYLDSKKQLTNNINEACSDKVGLVLEENSKHNSTLIFRFYPGAIWRGN